MRAPAGEEAIRQCDGQGAGEDLPIRVVLHAAHLSTGGVADGHGGAEHVAVDVVEGAVRAGGEALKSNETTDPHLGLFSVASSPGLFPAKLPKAQIPP